MSKIRKHNKNCNVKIELLFIAKKHTTQNASAKYKFWYEYPRIAKIILKRGSNAKYLKGFYIFLLIIHADFRNCTWSPQLWKYYIGSVFLWKLHILEQLFRLHLQVCFCVGKTEKQRSYSKTSCYLIVRL